MKIWLRHPVPVRITIKGVAYEIGPDLVAGGSGSMNLEVRRLDNGRSIKLQALPGIWYRDEYDRHAWFESLPCTPARKLADALLFQDLAVLEPGIGWSYRYERDMKWETISPGCEFHDGRQWCKKTSGVPPAPKLSSYLIRY